MIWLRAVYHAHTFHYRMPETAAISAVNPFVPSPLTVKMAMVAALLRAGRTEDAEVLSRELRDLDVRIRPPRAAVVFRSLMRYVRPPSRSDRRDLGTGSSYSISPHYREFALWCDGLEVFVGVPEHAARAAAWALERIEYLGAKDSLVFCETCGVCPDDQVPARADTVSKLDAGDSDETVPSGVIVQLADVVRPVELKRLIPGSRTARDYATGPYRLPGLVRGFGGARQYIRDVGQARSTILRA